MKLSDVKEKIDAFFNNISGDDFLKLLVEKYKLPVIYCVDMPDARPAFDNELFVKFSDLEDDSCVENDAVGISDAPAAASGEVTEYPQKHKSGNQNNNNSNPISFAA